MSDKLKNLIVRTISGIVLLGIVIGAITAGYWGYVALLMLIAGVGVWEFYKLAEARGAEPQRLYGLVATLLIIATSATIPTHIFIGLEMPTNLQRLTHLLIVVALATIPFSFAIEVFRNRQTPMANIAATIAGITYLALPLSMMCFISCLLNTNVEWNGYAILFFIFLIWGNDVFAYLAGISFGRHRLCERLSPKKSWEGFAGGIIGSAAMGALGAWLLDSSYGLWIGLAIVVALASVVGDLAESMLKREAGVKDSGKIMPGHGGMLDRFDAMLTAAPAALIYIVIFTLISSGSAL